MIRSLKPGDPQKIAAESCALCEQFAETGGPRHSASDRCESGKRPHCSCEVCF